MTDSHSAIASAMATLTPGDLRRFLERQRWSAAKGVVPADVRIVDLVVLPFGEGRYGIARVAATVGDRARLWQLPVVTGGSLPPDLADRFEISNNVRDATGDADFRRQLVDAATQGAVAASGELRWVAEPLSTARSIPGDARLAGVEQSNTSILVGNEAILKLFRTLQDGINPDVEVTRFLTTHAQFAHTPKLLATIRFETPSGEQTAGMLQELLPNATDAWAFALEQSRPYFAAPPTREAPNAFLATARSLGAITRELHEALASSDEDPAFAPEPATPEDVDRWAHHAQQSVRHALGMLEQRTSSSGFPRERLAEASALVGRRDHYLGWIDEIRDHVADDIGFRTRTHGDYHLGQVLRAASGAFAIIDFEGEPSRPIDDRRAKTSPLRDVAGMLRSFGYAAATLGISMEGKLDPATRELRTARWERDARAEFLDGYLTGGSEDDAQILPEDRASAMRLITLFETEKAFYELAYELENRPTWAWIPMRGISKLFTRS